MAKKLTCADISTQIDTFVNTTHKHFESHSYAAGALTAQLAFVLSTLPAHKQQETLQVLAQITAKYTAK